MAEWLEENLYLPGGFVRKLFAAGQVRMRGHAISPDETVPSRAKLWLLDEGSTSLEGEENGKAVQGDRDVNLPLCVLYEDDHILVVDKPAELLVHSDGTGVRDTLDVRVESYLRSVAGESQAFHVHRLDKGTTGCVMYAKHSFAARSLDTLMTKRRIHRTYLAVTSGVIRMEHGTLDAPIGRDRHRSGMYRVSPTGKPAVTRVYRLQTAIRENLSLVSCQLETGRTHQIRVHLSSIACPVVGDEQYGGTSQGEGWAWSGPGHALHAWKLTFLHPYTEEFVDVEARMPSSMESLFRDLDFSLDGVTTVK